jgi:tyrosine-protein kinase Etk/Wzc
MNPQNLPAPARAEDELDDPGLGISPLDLLTWLGEGKRLVGIVTAVAIVGSVIVALLLPLIYTARATLLPPGSQQQSTSAAALAALGSLGGLAGGLGAKTPDELYVSLLRSDTVQRALAAKFDLYKRYKWTATS